MTNLTHNSFLCIYFNSLHVSSNLVLIIRRINCINTTSGICHSVLVTVSCAGHLHTKRSPTQSYMYQMLYWYNWFSWWWARGCSKCVDNWNKYIEKNCASIWTFTKLFLVWNYLFHAFRLRYSLIKPNKYTYDKHICIDFHYYMFRHVCTILREFIHQI